MATPSYIVPFAKAFPDLVATPVVIVVRAPARTAPQLAEIDLSCSSPPWSESFFRSELTQEVTRGFLARAEGRIQGFLMCHLVAGEAHILNFGLRPEMRGKGVGRVLMVESLRRLKKEGVSRVFLEVRASNSVAQNLYTSLGFKHIANRKSYYSDTGEDALVMECHV